ncbi:hypothetical protein TSOC_005868 [Tetrabaena socialis]|uniref:Uncharacterized protein n=1 Tax=Tetrabaena socialis TaxID=47790 RepID=A0A2J8A5A2_9CHLO|nr:hypothetical protein TSOC_005868 [Tetrabaena socialis]|eukprot:PNH07698.1 hypothetical protein TSOC_005868 [Tetrabaena socialis]
MMDIQDRVAEREDENRFFVLRKFKNTNHHYMLRAAWDTLDGMFDHMTSKTFTTLRECAREKDIEWRSCPFIVLASSEKERRM